MWAKTQAQYFAREAQRRPFLQVVNAILKSELAGLVKASDLSQWQETLAILSTYAKQEEFPALCEALAERLENEAGDCKSANLCYMWVSRALSLGADAARCLWGCTGARWRRPLVGVSCRGQSSPSDMISSFRGKRYVVLDPWSCDVMGMVACCVWGCWGGAGAR